MADVDVPEDNASIATGANEVQITNDDGPHDNVWMTSDADQSEPSTGSVLDNVISITAGGNQSENANNTQTTDDPNTLL